MKKKKIKLCLTKQLSNMFKLWCKWGIGNSDAELTITEVSIAVTFDVCDMEFVVSSWKIFMPIN